MGIGILMGQVTSQTSNFDYDSVYQEGYSAAINNHKQIKYYTVYDSEYSGRVDDSDITITLNNNKTVKFYNFQFREINRGSAYQGVGSYVDEEGIIRLLLATKYYYYTYITDAGESHPCLLIQEFYSSTEGE